MADEATAAPDASGQTDIVQRSAGGEGALSAREAALSLVDTRRKEAAGEQNAGEAREVATADQSASQEAETAPQTEATGETEGVDPAQEPPLSPPRSWSKEKGDAWSKLDRATQEYLLEHDSKASTAIRTAQNDAAERAKGLTAKEQAAEQVRAQYEQALPMLLAALQDQQSGQFADIKSVADVERMAREDWPRYIQWDAQQKKIAAVNQEVQAHQQRQSAEKAQQWNTFAADEDAKFAEKAPDLADAKAKQAAATGAAEMLKELGFSDGELGDMWSGRKDVSLRDHRIQLLIRDGVKYREAQAAAKKAQPKPVPQVQRPGPAPARNADADGRVKDLTERLNKSGNLRDAAALLAARRAASR